MVLWISLRTTEPLAESSWFRVIDLFLFRVAFFTMSFGSSYLGSSNTEAVICFFVNFFTTGFLWCTMKLFYVEDASEVGSEAFVT